MQRAGRRVRHEFISTMYEHTPEIGDLQVFYDQHRGMMSGSSPYLWFFNRLLRYGTTLGRLAEEQCNGYQDWRGNWDEKATQRSERKEKRIKAKVTEICAWFGCKPVFQGDPRGNTLKIATPDGYTNDWGKEGICVPTS